MLVVYLFMYIFSFNLFQNSIFTSSIFLGIYLLLYLILHKKNRDLFFSQFLNKRVFMIFVFLTFIIIISLAFPTFHGTYDYSIIKTFINQFINLLIGLMLYSLYIYKGKQTKLLKHLIVVFIIQAIIQFTSFTFPVVNDFFNNFRSDKVIEKGQENYGGIRGLSLSSSSFFGLSSTYGLIFLIYLMNWKDVVFKSSVVKVFTFVLLIFGGLSAGRTSLIGLSIGIVFSILIILFQKRFRVKKMFQIKRMNAILSVIAIMILIIIGSVGIRTNHNDQQIDKLIQFSFQFYYNYKETGNVSTPSTDALFGRMYFLPETKTVLIGEGRYTNEDGSYYMRTDAGYMRDILYYGIFGIITLFIYQILFFNWKRLLVFQNILILTYLSILHLKGDVIGYLIMTQNVLFLYFLYNRTKIKENREISQEK